MSRKIIIASIIIAMIFMAGILSPSYASPLRLMAMGEMQGIVEDELDYQSDLTSFDFQHANASVACQSSYFSNSLPNNNVPSNFINDLERKGAQDKYQLNVASPVDSNFAVGLEYNKENRDYRSDYIDVNGNAQSLKRTGNTEAKTIYAGYALADWVTLGLAYDDNSVSDDYTGTEASRDGVVAKENSSFRGLSGGIKMYNPFFWFNLAMGEIKSINLTSQTISTTEVYSSSGSGRGGLSIGGKLFDGKIRLNLGGMGQKIGASLQAKSLLGMQIKPSDELVLGLGCTYDLNSVQYFEFSNVASKIGFEYAVPALNSLKIRGGLINRIAMIQSAGGYKVNLQDYTLGLGYKWEKMKIDFAYKNYQDVTGLGSSWLTTSTPLTVVYMPTFSNERSWVYVFSVGYEI